MKKHCSLKPSILGNTYKFWKMDFKHSAPKKTFFFVTEKLLNSAHACCIIYHKRIYFIIIHQVNIQGSWKQFPRTPYQLEFLRNDSFEPLKPWQCSLGRVAYWLRNQQGALDPDNPTVPGAANGLWGASWSYYFLCRFPNTYDIL